VLAGITHETRAILEFMCYGDMCFLSIGDIWDFLESLAWYQWHHEITSESFECPSSFPVIRTPILLLCAVIVHLLTIM